MEHKEDALKSFYANEAVKHVDFKLEKHGLYIHKTKPYIGASHDALPKVGGVRFPSEVGKLAAQVGVPYLEVDHLVGFHPRH